MNERSVTVREAYGPRGGEYFIVDLADGREVVLSQKAGDNRVWLGVEGDPSTFRGQRGGVGNLESMIDDTAARMAMSTEARELYFALRALADRKRAHETH